MTAKSLRSVQLVLLLVHSALALSSTPESPMSPAATGAAIRIPIGLRDNFPFLVATVDGIEVPFFGPWQFDLLDVELPGFDGVIGYDFFARHVVCVDFPGNRLVIDPQSH